MGSPSSYVGLLAACVAALLFVASALADVPPQPPPGTPSIDQYVETIPTSQGGAAVNVGKTRARRLPPAITAKLRTRTDPVAKHLEEIATSSTYGAPQKTLSPPVRKGQRERINVAAEPEGENPLSAAVSAVSDSGDSHMFWLLAGVIVVTTAMVWATARRHRSWR
jgi:hypothetical protein